jgi:bifunctional non-homologous end joining protein LigD
MTLTIEAGRRKIEISRPDKALFPCGITKADLARYYERVAGTMLYHIDGRALNLERYPDGVDGHKIFQQHASGHFPSWIARVEVPGRDRPVEHVVATEPATLVYLAGQACVTLHQWLSRRDRLDRPDRLVIDLDPSVQRPAEIRKAARIFGGLLRELELEPHVMTTGSRGYHVVVALRRRAGFEEIREFARELALVAAAREPRMFTNEQRKAKREGKILIDIQRNAYAHTSVAPYSVRARPGGPVATPLHWEELDRTSTRADRWTLTSAPERLEAEGDPWAEIGRNAQTLTAARKRLRKLAADGGLGR